jgi:hypothetical protein
MELNKIKRYLALALAEAEHDDREFEFPEGFKESFECQDAFRGWINYRITWYIDEENDPWKVIALKRPLIEEWHDTLRKVVPVITPDGEIMGAEEWEKKSNSMN